MKKLLPLAAALFVVTLPASAQNWSIGIHTGPFIFGDFLERRIRVGTPEGGADPVTLTLSAATRAGAMVDIEREFADRWGVRLEGTFTRSKLSVRDESDSDGVSIDAGDLDVTTIALPLIFRINSKGSVRFHLHGGPAMAMYHIENPGTSSTVGNTRTLTEWGATVGGGVAWWLNDRFAIEGNFSDTVTASPFEEQEGTTQGIDAKRPHNIHTTAGLRWRF
jgi:opacity protein-like surface antigen